MARHYKGKSKQALITRLKKSADKAVAKVRRAGGFKCGKSKGNRPAMCIATVPPANTKDWKCAKNPINKLWACVAKNPRARLIKRSGRA